MAVVNLMSENEDEEDWMKYASAGFGQTNYSLWDEQETLHQMMKMRNQNNLTHRPNN